MSVAQGPAPPTQAGHVGWEISVGRLGNSLTVSFFIADVSVCFFVCVFKNRINKLNDPNVKSGK